MALRSDRLDAVVNLSKRRGFVYPSSDIYGGLRAAWDYGPLGVELKNNVKRQWWRYMVQERDDIVGLDSSVILAPRGLGGQRPRRHLHRPADRVPVLPQALPGRPPDRGVRGQARPRPAGRPGRHRVPELRQPGHVHRAQELQRDAPHLPRPGRGRVRPGLPAAGDRAGDLHQLQERAHDLAAEGPVRHRPGRQVVPQRDHARNFIFRTREFEQMEMEFFVKPGTDEEWHQRWIDHRLAWWTGLGVNRTTSGCTSTRRRS